MNFSKLEIAEVIFKGTKVAVKPDFIALEDIRNNGDFHVTTYAKNEDIYNKIINNFLKLKSIDVLVSYNNTFYSIKCYVEIKNSGEMTGSGFKVEYSSKIKDITRVEI